MTSPESPPPPPDTPQERLAEVLELRPDHAVPDDGLGHRVERRRGRPRRAVPRPGASEIDYASELNRLRKAWVNGDLLVKLLDPNERANAAEIISTLKGELAREAAALRYEIEERATAGRDIAQLGSRRIDALVKIASIELAAMKLGMRSVDLGGAQMQRIFAAFMDQVANVLVETVPEKVAASFANKLRAKLEGWEERVST